MRQDMGKKFEITLTVERGLHSEVKLHITVANIVR